MVNAMAVIKMVFTILSSHFFPFKNLFRNLLPSLATPCPPTSYQAYSTKRPAQITVKFVEQIMEILKLINTKQKPPPPYVKPLDDEKPKARVLILEFKKVNEM
jgi:hypothetical protein